MSNKNVFFQFQLSRIFKKGAEEYEDSNNLNLQEIFIKYKIITKYAQ